MRDRGGDAVSRRRHRLFRAVAGAMLAVVILRCETGAADTIAAWIGRGYVLRTTVRAAGAFRGCRKDVVVPLLNGNSFACDFANAVYAYNPTFTLLQNLATGENALVSGDTEYVGTLIIGEPGLLGSRLRITVVAEPAGSVRSSAVLQPLEGLQAAEAGRPIGAVKEPPAIAGIDQTAPRLPSRH